MKARLFRLFIGGTITADKSAVHLLYCNGGESLSRKHFFHNRPASAAFKESFDLSSLSGEHTDLASYASLLKSFGSCNALEEGKCIHHLIVSQGLYLDIFLVGHLVQMYGACAAFDDASSLFVIMHDRSVFSWNFLVRACARHGENEKVLTLFNQMQFEGVIPTKVTFVSIIDACTGLATLDAGVRMHALIINSPFEDDVVLGTALVNMYGIFNNIEGVWLCFHKMQERDVVAWTALISALSQCDRRQEALNSFEQMLQEATLPNEVTFISLCDACANCVMLPVGKRLHALVSCIDLEGNVVLENALINMYGKCGGVEFAEAVFKRMTCRTLVSWTAVISAYAHNGYGEEACQHFSHMQELGILPDNVLLTTILSACASFVLLAICKRMHAMISIREPDMDVFVGTSLVHAYGKCQDLVSAEATFDQLGHRNAYSWNAVIMAFSQNGLFENPDRLFNQMQQEGILPNKVTFVSILDACSIRQSAVRCGEQLHACMLHGEVEVQTSLINMYGRWGRLGVAQSTFDCVTERKPIFWNVLISVYVQHDQIKKALGCFVRMCSEVVEPDEATFVSVLSTCDCEAMLEDGQLIHVFIIECECEHNVVVGTALVSMYGRCERVEDARAVFDRMERRTEVSWNAMIAVHEQAGQSKEVFEVFERMQHDEVLPDYVTFMTMISACIAQFALWEGKIVHAFLLESGCEADVVLVTAIMNMYGKSGIMEDAYSLFNGMEVRTVVSWNTMIAVCAQHGLAMEALSLFSKMQADGLLPNNITFVNTIGACSHCGYIDEACHHFNLMLDFCMLSPISDNYVCLIDLFGRAGGLDEAQAILDSMPLLPSAASFKALLGACRYRDDIERGHHASKHAFEMDPENHAPYLMLVNLYAAGIMDDVVLAVQLFESSMQETGSVVSEDM